METNAPPSLREWVREHDEKWLFVVLYLGLAVGLSVLVSLFWLLVVAVLHFVLELFRQAHYREGRRDIALHALWEVKLDIALILLALMLVLYIEVVLGLLGIQSAARAAAASRAGARIATRAAAWERNLRTFLLTVDEMVRVLHAGVMLRRKRSKGRKSAHVEATSAQQNPNPVTGEATLNGASDEPRGPDRTGPLPPVWRMRWKVVDHIGIVLVVLGVLLIAAAPWLTPHDWGSAGAALLEELRPLPGSSSHGG